MATPRVSLTDKVIKSLQNDIKEGRYSPWHAPADRANPDQTIRCQQDGRPRSDCSTESGGNS